MQIHTLIFTMFKNTKCSKVIFWRNCLILYILVGFCSASIADFYKSFQLSYQSDNASKFSRIMSLNVAYSVKRNLSK